MNWRWREFFVWTIAAVLIGLLSYVAFAYRGDYACLFKDCFRSARMR